jgi:hypothetical protein
MTIPIYALTDVWGNPSQRFTALQMNVQDGGHQSGSLLIDFQVNGVSELNYDPDTNQFTIVQNLKFGPDPTGIAGSDIFALRNGSRPQAVVAYNNWIDTNNWERGGVGWALNPGTLSVGTSKNGTGTLRPVFFTGSNFYVAQADLGFYRVAAGVLEINTGSPGVRTGCYLKWGGTARATADVSYTSNVTLANVAGMVVNVAAGRTYGFEVDIPFTCAAAGGIRCAIAGTATATNIIYDGWIVDSAANGIKGNTRASALAAAVANAAIAGTAGHVTISGTITVNAAGTLTVQAAQSVTNGTATVVKQGAKFIVDDIT